MKIKNKRQIELIEQLLQIQIELEELGKELKKEGLHFGTRYITDDGMNAYQDFWSFGIGDSSNGLKQEIQDFCLFHEEEFEQIKLHEHLQQTLVSSYAKNKRREIKL